MSPFFPVAPASPGQALPRPGSGEGVRCEKVWQWEKGSVVSGTVRCLLRARPAGSWEPFTEAENRTLSDAAASRRTLLTYEVGWEGDGRRRLTLLDFVGMVHVDMRSKRKVRIRSVTRRVTVPLLPAADAAVRPLAGSVPTVARLLAAAVPTAIHPLAASLPLWKPEPPTDAIRAEVALRPALPPFPPPAKLDRALAVECPCDIRRVLGGEVLRAGDSCAAPQTFITAVPEAPPTTVFPPGRRRGRRSSIVAPRN
eukprot:TRINITY_DN17250_c0_g1_i3.p2 TRINITY_DN17250_c0_g1~~TRINITY_DN17250_c0_g1_i3.p2  ORF type:complete len:255 (+),score=71.34 TRINITY_DN17250_c0_g1_i3:55-819(+)